MARRRRTSVAGINWLFESVKRVIGLCRHVNQAGNITDSILMCLYSKESLKKNLFRTITVMRFTILCGGVYEFFRGIERFFRWSSLWS